MKILIAVALIFTCCSTLAGSNFKKVGGCLVSELYKRDESDNYFKQYCQNREKALRKRESQWLTRIDANLLSTELLLAYQAAEKGISGNIYGVSKGRNVTLIIDPGENVNAGVTVIDNTVYILLNAGIINMAADAVNAVGFELAKQMNPEIVGTSFANWAELFRVAAYLNESYVPSPGPDKPSSSWYVTGLSARLSLYQFIFAHELAHLYKGSYCGKSRPRNALESARVEAACDKLAINSFKTYQGISDLGLYLPAFQYAHSALLSLFGNEMVNTVNLNISNHREAKLIEELVNTIHPRLKKNMDIILSNKLLKREDKEFLKLYFRNVAKQPLPIFATYAKHQSRNYVDIKLVGVDWGNKICGFVTSGYVIKNENSSRGIEVTVDIRTVLKPRDANRNFFSVNSPKLTDGTQYQLIDLERHTLALAPGEGRFISSRLPCAASDDAFPSVNAQLVASDWL